jgi:DNA polymerase-1
MEKFLLVDGNSILNRAYFGIRPLTTKDGLNTNAVYGVATILRKHLDALKPQYAAAAFDLAAPTLRKQKYDAYKATRKGMPPELAEQLPYIKRVFAAMGFAMCSSEGYEADDIIGTLSRLAEERGGVETYILTGDRDALQLIGGETRVILARTKEDALYDEARFREEYGISPAQFVDVKALMGDASDNIPGVPGIGEKTALKLIAERGSLDAVYDDLDAAPAGASAKAKLAAGRESAFMSRELAKIIRDAPTPPLAECVRREYDRAELYEIFTKLEFNALLTRFGLTAADASASADGGDSSDASASTASETTASDTAAHDAAAPAATVSDAPDPSPAVATDDEPPYIDDGAPVLYLADGVVYTSDGAFALGDEALRAYNGKAVVTHGFGALYGALKRAGIHVRCAFDTELAAYCLRTDGGFTLDRVALRYLSDGDVGRDAGAAGGADAGHDADAEHDGDAGNGAATGRKAASKQSIDPRKAVAAIANLRAALAPKIEATGAANLLYGIEQPLAAVLADMSEVGVRVDVEGLREYGRTLKASEDELTQRIYEAAGGPFNINSPKQLGEVLFGRLGLPHGKKTKTGWSTNAEVLEALRPFAPIVADVLDYRRAAKLRATYCDGLEAVADENGRVHTSFNQTLTATGRLSSSDPNLQNIPQRTEMGRELRRCFIPADGYLLVDADYSQIELRILAAVSGDENMKSAFERGEDIHTATAASVFGVPRDEVTPAMRSHAKAVNFGIVYGIGAFSLAADIGVSRAEADEYIKNYLAAYPKVDQYLKETVERAKRDGYVTTVFGRRRYIPELTAHNRNLRAFGERVAMNSPIQGAAADVIKIAMVRVADALAKSGLDARLVLQVHDELLVEAREDCAEAAAALLKREMELAASLGVALTAETSIGRTWYECK